jgi:hypothetical protein
LVWDPARNKESERDLNSEFFSAGLDAAPSEPLMKRNSEDISPKLEAEPRESENDRNSKFFSLRFEAEPSEPVRVLKMDDCLVNPEA